MLSIIPAHPTSQDGPFLPLVTWLHSHRVVRLIWHWSKASAGGGSKQWKHITYSSMSIPHTQHTHYSIIWFFYIMWLTFHATLLYVCGMVLALCCFSVIGKWTIKYSTLGVGPHGTYNTLGFCLSLNSLPLVLQTLVIALKLAAT